MDAVLQQAIAPVLRDLEMTAGVAMPSFNGDWPDNPATSGTILRGANGGGRGVYVVRAAPLAAQVVMAADQVQEWVIEELWATAPTNWPACPNHPRSHPMTAAELGERALWTCPADQTPTAVIGELQPPQAPARRSRDTRRR